MVKNTTPVAPTTFGNASVQKKGVDVREPLKTDMDSARMYGDRSPAKGKMFCPDKGYKS